MPIFPYFICGTPTTAWLASGAMSAPLNRKSRAAEAKHENLTAAPLSQLQEIFLKYGFEETTHSVWSDMAPEPRGLYWETSIVICQEPHKAYFYSIDAFLDHSLDLLQNLLKSGNLLSHLANRSEECPQRVLYVLFPKLKRSWSNFVSVLVVQGSRWNILSLFFLMRYPRMLKITQFTWAQNTQGHCLTDHERPLENLSSNH